jgi:hypothetical protein
MASDPSEGLFGEDRKPVMVKIWGKWVLVSPELCRTAVCQYRNCMQAGLEWWDFSVLSTVLNLLLHG